MIRKKICNISIEELNEINNAQLVDVRTREEFRTGSLSGSINIPLDVLPKNLDELDPGRSIIVFCRSGKRSSTAAQILIKKGFKKVYNLKNGLISITEKYNDRKNT